MMDKKQADAPRGEGEAPAEPLLAAEHSTDRWVRYWKSQFTKRHCNPAHRWHPNHWDTRLRASESYESKGEYVRSNPVRHGLVERAEDWPFQGEIHVLPWD